MRITELTGYKDNPIYKQAKQDIGIVDPQEMGDYNDPDGKPFDKFYNYIQQHGFKRLGTGTFANVYEKPGYPWVFKLFKDDDPYIWYYKYCRANQNNPHVPRIKGNLIKISDDTFCVRMEKLTPYPETPEYKKLYDHIRYALYQLLDDAYSGVIDPLGWQPNEKEIIRRQEALHFLKHTYPQLYKVLVDLANHGTDWDLDLHDNNLMLRGNTIVITDPIAHTSLGF